MFVKWSVLYIYGIHAIINKRSQLWGAFRGGGGGSKVVCNIYISMFMQSSTVRAGVCRPCVATDGNWSGITLCRHKRAYDRIQLVADSCRQSRMFNFYDQLPIKLVLSRRRRHKRSYDRDQLYLKSCRSTQTFSTRRHKLKLQLVAVSSIVSPGRHTPALRFHIIMFYMLIIWNVNYLHQ